MYRIAIAAAISLLSSHAWGAESPYLEKYKIPEDASGAETIQFCRVYGIATVWAAQGKLDGRSEREVTRMLEQQEVQTRYGNNPPFMANTLGMITIRVFRDGLPAKDVTEMGQEAQRRCREQNGLPPE